MACKRAPRFVQFAFVIVVAIWLYGWQLGSIDLRAGLLAVLLGSAAGAVWNLWWALSNAKNCREANRGEVWECRLTDQAWSSRRSDGITVSYPWSTMRLVFTHSDGFLIETGLRSIVIDRKPLVDAGLEEMFVARMPNRGS